MNTGNFFVGLKRDNVGKVAVTFATVSGLLAGATADAVAILRPLRSIPAGKSVSFARLRIDPLWDPICDDPGFRHCSPARG